MSDELSKPCLKCGYDIRGLDSQMACPECGFLVGLSLLDGWELRNNHPRWLERLIVGARLAALGMLLYPATLWFVILIAETAQRIRYQGPRWAVRPPVSTSDWIELSWRTAVGFVPSLVLIAGLWLLCSKCGRAAEDQPLRRTRRVIRVISLLLLMPAVVALIAALDFLQRIGWITRYFDGFDWVLGVSYTLAAFLPPLCAHYLRRLARRAPAPYLATDSPIVGWVLATCLICPIINFVLEKFQIRLLSAPISNLLFGSIALWVGLTITAYFWSFMILIRYAWAFRRALNQSAEIFRDADASVAPAA